MLKNICGMAPAFAGLLLALAPAPSCLAGDSEAPSDPARYTVEALMKCAAGNAATILGHHKLSSVGIKVDPESPSMTGGANALLERLYAQLEEQKLTVDSAAKYTLLLKAKLDTKPGLVLHLAAYLIDRDGNNLIAGDGKIVEGDIDEAKEILPYTDVIARAGDGGTIALMAVQKPQATLKKDGTQAFADDRGKMGVELLVDSGSQKLKLVSGRCSTQFKRDQVYRIRLINTSVEEVMASVRVDGLSVFHFSDVRAKDGPRKGQPKYQYYVVPANGEAVIEGWHKRINERGETVFKDFTIGAPDESAAGRLGKADLVGVICVEFFSTKRASPEDKLVQTELRLAQAKKETRKKQDVNQNSYTLNWVSGVPIKMTAMGVPVGTGMGTEKVGDVKEVQRWVGPLLERVAIHYQGER
jgi:hypothetical protein